MLVLVSAIASQNVNAALITNLITNGDFEDVVPNQAGLAFARDLNDLANQGAFERYDTYADLAGWKTLFGFGIEVQHTTSAVALLLKAGTDFSNNGNLYVELDTEVNDGLGPNNTDFNDENNTDRASNSGMFQELSNLIIGQTYDLSFWYLARSDDSDPSVSGNGIDVYWGNSQATLSTSIIGNVDLDQTGPINNFQQWTKYTYQIKATHEEMKVGFGATGAGNESGGLIDNVSLAITVDVPEPTTLVLFLGGLLGLGLRQKRS
jgi:hypothetical protein